MSEVKEIELHSWDEFKTQFVKYLFGEERFEKGKFIFRGQSNAAWNLQPSFDRRVQNLPDTGKRLQVGVYLKNQLVNELQRVGVPIEILNDDRKVLALGQHYGMPTRLLDWTESPYIAAFFAFTSNYVRKDNDKVAIWSLDTTSPIWSELVGVEVMTPQPVGNMRLRNQTGKFTLSRTPFDNLEEYVAYFKDGGAPLIKFILPASESMSALTDLDAMGINHSSLFPDIEGLILFAVFKTVQEFGVVIR